MNNPLAVGTPPETSQELVIAKRKEAIATNLGQIRIYIPNSKEIHEEIEKFIVQGEQLNGQADRALIESKIDYASGGDLIKIIRGQTKTATEYRRSIVDPINKFIKFFNALFKDSEILRDQATSTIQRKVQAWSDAERAAQRAQEEETRRLAEEVALKRAEAAPQAVDQDAILEVAAEVIEEAVVKGPRNLARGDYGSTSSTRRIVAGEVSSVKMLCMSVADGRAPEAMVTFSKAQLNALAQKAHAEKKIIPGLEIIVREPVIVR